MKIKVYNREKERLMEKAVKDAGEGIEAAKHIGKFGVVVVGDKTYTYYPSHMIGKVVIEE